jgi:hypothetical protein
MADGVLYRCAQPGCSHPDDLITAGVPFDLAHAADGRSYLGPAHPDCNRATRLAADEG